MKRTLTTCPESLDHYKDPEPATKDILKFIGMDWNPRRLQFQKSGRAVYTASYKQVHQPRYTQSLQRWKNHEKHIGPLKEIMAPFYRKTGA